MKNSQNFIARQRFGIYLAENFKWSAQRQKVTTKKADIVEKVKKTKVLGTSSRK
jgi:hypothetical protein